MNNNDVTGTLDTIIIGGGQAGLALGHYLKDQHRKFLILDANPGPAMPGASGGIRSGSSPPPSTTDCRAHRSRRIR